MTQLAIMAAKDEKSSRAVAARARAAYIAAGLGNVTIPKAPAQITFPSPSVARWQKRHEAMSWSQIQTKWITLRSEIEALAGKYDSENHIDMLYELGQLECFIEDNWADQDDVVNVIRAERLARKLHRPTF